MERRPWTLCNEMVKAIYEKNYSAVQKLLDEGLDIDTELMCHKCPIMICIEANSLKIGELLISEGCSLSLKTIVGNTPLHIAVELSNYDFVKLLLDNRADLTSVDDSGKTALHLAAQMNSLRMVKMLMEKATPGVLNIADTEGKTPFIHACCCGNDALISYFLNHGCNANIIYGPSHDTPLLGTLSNHNLSLNTINMLLSAGANINMINKAGETPLLKAFHKLSSNNFCSLTYSLFQNVCCLLIDMGSNVNESNALGYTPLHFAVVMNNELLVRKLLNCGSLVNATNHLGFSPLFYACKKGMYKIASLLIDNGADVRHICYLIREQRCLWPNEEHRMPDSVLSYVIRKSKECQNLQNSCRLVIRKNLPKDIEKSALLLPLPIRLIKFIQLVE